MKKDQSSAEKIDPFSLCPPLTYKTIHFVHERCQAPSNNVNQMFD